MEPPSMNVAPKPEPVGGTDDIPPPRLQELLQGLQGERIVFMARVEYVVSMDQVLGEVGAP